MIEFITYKDKQYPIRVSYYVIMMAQKESGVSLDQLEKDIESQQSLLWYALQAGHKLADAELTLKREDMVWILDECYIEFQKAIYTFARKLVEMQDEVIAESKKK